MSSEKMTPGDRRMLIGIVKQRERVANRLELLDSNALPLRLRMKLVMAALLMEGDGLVSWTSKHDFKITERGIATFEAKYSRPSRAADLILAMPGQ